MKLDEALPYLRAMKLERLAESDRHPSADGRCPFAEALDLAIDALERLRPKEPTPARGHLCPYPNLHAADCECRGEGGAR